MCKLFYQELVVCVIGCEIMNEHGKIFRTRSEWNTRKQMPWSVLSEHKSNAVLGRVFGQLKLPEEFSSNWVLFCIKLPENSKLNKKRR